VNGGPAQLPDAPRPRAAANLWHLARAQDRLPVAGLPGQGLVHDRLQSVQTVVPPASGGGCGIVWRQTNCVKLLGAGAARTFAHRSERCHQDQVDPGSIHEQKPFENAFFLETAGRVGRNRPRIVAEYDKADALEIEMVPTVPLCRSRGRDVCRRRSSCRGPPSDERR
jgi:hypothetical protein